MMRKSTSYWWRCELCNSEFDFDHVTNQRGIAHYIWNNLLASEWDQSLLIKQCLSCGQNGLRITYVFPRKNPPMFSVISMIGIESNEDKYLPMMWETYPHHKRSERLFDFKYLIGKNINGLNKPAVLTREDLQTIFKKYQLISGDNKFP